MEIKLIAAHFMIDKDRRTIGVQHYIMVMVTMAMAAAITKDQDWRRGVQWIGARRHAMDGIQYLNQLLLMMGIVKCSVVHFLLNEMVKQVRAILN